MADRCSCWWCICVDAEVVAACGSVGNERVFNRRCATTIVPKRLILMFDDR